MYESGTAIEPPITSLATTACAQFYDQHRTWNNIGAYYLTIDVFSTFY